jgi:hypothetical protein
MTHQPQSDHKPDASKSDFSAIFSKWGEVFSQTYESYCQKEPNPSRRHGVTLVVFSILGILAMSFSGVLPGVQYAFLGLVALVLVLSKRTE